MENNQQTNINNPILETLSERIRRSAESRLFNDLDDFYNQFYSTAPMSRHRKILYEMMNIISRLFNDLDDFYYQFYSTTNQKGNNLPIESLWRYTKGMLFRIMIDDYIRDETNSFYEKTMKK